MMAAFIIGTIMGGAISGLPFTLDSITTGNIECACCQTTSDWSICSDLPYCKHCGKAKILAGYSRFVYGGDALIHDDTNTDTTEASGMNVIICVAGAFLFSIGFGAVSTLVLKKRDIL
jgi:hypothetical protein